VSLARLPDSPLRHPLTFIKFCPSMFVDAVRVLFARNRPVSLVHSLRCLVASWIKKALLLIALAASEARNDSGG
jgi:hypothetical protein